MAYAKWDYTSIGCILISQVNQLQRAGEENFTSTSPEILFKPSITVLLKLPLINKILQLFTSLK